MATVTPGKIFTSNEIVTPANLNLLGTPTVALADGEVTAAKIAADAVTTARILDLNVTGPKIATDSVTTAKIATDAVTTAKIAANAVTAAKLGTTEQKQICKAWVNFNGTTSPGTIRSNFNVSSVTKNGTGDYTVNFTSSLADANYSACVSVAAANTNVGYYLVAALNNSVRLAVGVASPPSLSDVAICSLQVFGN